MGCVPLWGGGVCSRPAFGVRPRKEALALVQSQYLTALSLLPDLSAGYLSYFSGVGM